MDPHNKWYWSADNATLIHKIPLYDIKGGVWYAMNAMKTTVPNFFSKTINSPWYITQVLIQFSNTCPVIRLPMPFFGKTVQEAHTANNLLLVTEK